jgi:Ca2+-binding RTX toxin-like protein
MAIITGSAIADTLFGTSSDDEIYGLSADDQLQGGGGNDLIDGGAGIDSMAGGTGDDVYFVDEETDIVSENAGEGVDEVRSTAAYYVLADNVENLTGLSTSTYQQLIGNALDNVITGGAAWNYIDAGAGDDTIVHSEGGDGVGGGDGWDTYLLPGSQSDYEITQNEWGVNVLDLGSGGGAFLLGVEAIRFAADNLTVTIDSLFNRYGTSGDDVLVGNNSDNFLYGYAGNDDLSGGAGADELDGGSGADLMAGGDGDDLYLVDDSGDSLVEAAGGGYDTAIVSVATYTLPSEVEVLWTYLTADCTFTGNAGDNWLDSDAGNDTLSGLAGDDLLVGRGGDDTLLGGSGNDVLEGCEGSDVLAGGSGSDILAGGDGADLFVFAPGDSPVGASDTIWDFVSGTDLIDLSALDADSGTSGNQAFAFIGATAFTGVAGQLRSTFDGVDTWLQGDTNGDMVADFEIRLLGEITPVSTDFIL